LSENIHCNQKITQLDFNNNQRHIRSNQQTWQAANLALCCPAPIQSQLLQPLFPELASQLAQIEYAPVAVVIQEFKRDDFHKVPKGFGALMTRSERSDGVLGILFTSHIFPDHTGKDIILTRTILGGSICPDVVQKSNQELMHLALSRHQKIFDTPNLQHQRALVIKHPLGIPKYPKGHLKIQEAVENFHQSYPNIRLSGNHLFGVAVKDCIRNAKVISQHFNPQLQ